MKLLILPAALALLVGCGEKEVDFSRTNGQDGKSCTVTEVQGGVELNCSGDVVFVGDGKDGSNGVDGQDGTNGQDGVNGLTSLIDARRGLIDMAICTSESGVIINAGLDTNRNNTLDETEITKVVAVCDGQDGADGQDGQDGADGQDGTQSEFQIVEIIDPCGDYQSLGNSDDHDEVLLRLQNGTILAWYKNLGLTLLMPGYSYRTTDNQKCDFKINNDGSYQEI